MSSCCKVVQGEVSLPSPPVPDVLQREPTYQGIGQCVPGIPVVDAELSKLTTVKSWRTVYRIKSHAATADSDPIALCGRAIGDHIGDVLLRLPSGATVVQAARSIGRAIRPSLGENGQQRPTAIVAHDW